MDGLRAAFGLKEAPVEGDAFDRELQERKRLERQAERENAAKERERAKRVRARMKAGSERALSCGVLA